MITEAFLPCTRRGLAALAVALTGTFAAQAATFEIFNLDPPGVGFNDAAVATPVGGNAGTTVGEQRQIVFAKVAEIWGGKLRSDVPIRVLASFSPLDCNDTGAVLGAAGAYNIFADFPNAARANTWYPSALANKLAGVPVLDSTDPFVNSDIISFFNGDLGKPGCLTGTTFYLGLDGKAGPDQIDLLTTVLHEFGHGLGFQTFTDELSGEQVQPDPPDPNAPDGLPSIWDHFLFDPQQRKVWAQMTNDQRVASAIVPRNLVWNGRTVTRAAPRVLDRGVADLFVTGSGLNRFVLFGEAAFGPRIDRRTLVSAPIVPVVDQADGRGLACDALNAANAAAVRGKVALIDRGSCAFTVKVKNAQNAGAKAVLIADNQPGSPPFELLGDDATITIPSGRITRDDGAAIKAALGKKGAISFAVLFLNELKLAGADYLNRLFLFSPNPAQPGSSISHYDTLARPNLLMEPFAEPNQAIAVSAPQDLTLELLRDIGW